MTLKELRLEADGCTVAPPPPPHHVFMRVTGKIYRAIVLSTLLYEAWRLQTTGEKYACLHDAQSALDHEDNLDGQSDKQGHTRTDRGAIYGRSSDQEEYPVDWTPHGDVTRQATKAGSLLSTVFWSQKERARLRFKDTIKRNLKLRDITTDSWASLSQRRDKWRAIV